MFGKTIIVILVLISIVTIGFGLAHLLYLDAMNSSDYTLIILIASLISGAINGIMNSHKEAQDGQNSQVPPTM